MIVGTEWLVDATGCDAEKLRDLDALKSVFAQIIHDLELKVVGEPLWHQFPDAFGITGMALLTESHLTCHTYPEYKAASFNLYCCRERPNWNWEETLKNLLGAAAVSIKRIRRGTVENESAVNEVAMKVGGGGQ